MPDIGRKQIIILDDDEMYIAMLKPLIRSVAKNVEIITFKSPLHALEYFKDDGNRPTAIILDVEMPIMDGWGFLELCEQRSGLRHIPVYMVTSHINFDIDQKINTYKNLRRVFKKPLKKEQIALIMA